MVEEKKTSTDTNIGRVFEKYKVYIPLADRRAFLTAMQEAVVVDAHLLAATQLRMIADMYDKAANSSLSIAKKPE